MSDGQDLSTMCSQVWDAREEPVWGTAAHAAWWVGIEQPGPWGAKGARASRLGDHQGESLERAIKQAGGRLSLLRRPGGERDRPQGQGRRVMFARPATQASDTGIADTPAEVWHTTVSYDVGLPQLPWDQLPGATPAELPRLIPGLELSQEPEAWVCAHAKRDLCCAVRGRALAKDVEQTYPGQAWECTHLVGHRFAPTAVMWPSAQALGRCTYAVLAEVMGSPPHHLTESSLDPRVHRGCVFLTPVHQAAAAAVRHHTRFTAQEPTLQLRESSVPPRHYSAVEDLRTIPYQVFDAFHHTTLLATVVVIERTADEAPVSCGGAPVASTRWETRILT